MRANMHTKSNKCSSKTIFKKNICLRTQRTGYSYSIELVAGMYDIKPL